MSDRKSVFLTSLKRLCRYVNRRKRDKLLSSKDLFNLEINIFFDNVFDNHTTQGKNAKKRPEWLPKDFTEWQTLNKYVKSFGRIFGQNLIAQGQKKALEEAKTILTPYGGRLEYSIDQINFHVHLKVRLKITKLTPKNR